MLELARLYLTLDDVNACQEQCSDILKNDQCNEDATLVCSTIVLLNKDHELFQEATNLHILPLDDG